MDENQLAECVVFAERLAARFFRTVAVGGIEFEDIRGAALLGLAESMQRYVEGRGAAFKTFAYLRIRGAMCDYLRKERRLRAGISGESVPQVPPAELPDPEFTVLNRGSAAPVARADIEETVDLRIASARMQQALRCVSESQRQIVEKYYFEDKPFSQIGAELGGIAKATVCRHHKAALSLLKQELASAA